MKEEEIKYTNKKDLVVLNPNGTTIQTRLTDCLKCIYTLKDYTGNKYIMPFDVACIELDKRLKAKYNKPWKEISEEKYNYMLECLPPMNWKTTLNVNMFAMSERMKDSFTEHLAVYKNKYYSAIRDLKLGREEITKDFLKQIKGELK